MIHSMYYVGQKTEPLTLAETTNGKNLYRKELIYTGQFVKTHGDGRKQEFEITLATLQHFHNTFNMMLSNGVEVPVPAEHTDEPDKRRGTLRRTEIAKNALGLDALYGYIEFNDVATADQNKNNNVSIYVPVKKTDGKGNVYNTPIEHVALTDYPVIPGLGKFELVASFTPGKSGEKNMDKIAQLLGIDSAAPDMEAAITAAIEKLLSDVKKAGEKPAPEPVKVSEEKKIEPEPKALSQPIAETMAKMVAGSRTLAIDSLVGTYLTPAAATALKKQYCDTPALSLSLVNTGDAGESNFESTLNIIKANGQVLKLGEKSGAQLTDDLELSGSDLVDSKKNPLLASVERFVAANK